MCRLISLVVALSLFVPAAAIAAAPAVEDVQGLYEGTRTDSGEAHKFEARVVALGKGAYKVFIREASADGAAVTKVELAGKTEGDAVTFSGKNAAGDWSAAYANGGIAGACIDGKVEMKRVVRVSPTMGAKPPHKGPQGPAGAVVLIDSKNFSEVVAKPDKDGKPQEWQVAADGGVLVAKGGITSKRSFDGSFKMHVEFKSPLRPDAQGQGRGNSGCFMPNGDEVQVLDSFGMTTYKGGGCGGIYKYKDPDAFDEFSLASAPPGQWQTYDIEYTVETKDGKPAGKPVITVIHNGIKIHDKFRLQRDAKAGPFQFQDHGNPVQYRNIWVLPIKEAIEPLKPAIGTPNRQPAFVRAEDAGEDFSRLETSEVIRRLTQSTDRIVQRKAAKVLGDRHLAGKLPLSQEEQAAVDGYVDKVVGLTAAATGEERTDAVDLIRRLWRLAAEKLIDSLGNKNMAIVEAAAKNLALMRNADIVQRIVARLKASNDTQFKIGAILALGVMREKRECLVPDRMTLGDDESEALATKVIMPVLTELQASETDARTLQMLKMAFQFLKNPPDARPQPGKRQ